MKLLLALLLVLIGYSASDITVPQLFYHTLNSTAYCFRLTNATHQIGCSASSSQTRGVLYYVDELEDITLLQQNATHAPYVVLMEPEFFTGDDLTVRHLKSMESTVKGIIVRYDANSTLNRETLLSHFSPERRCPNEETDSASSTCQEGDYWNEAGTELIFTDFGNFPIFLIDSSDFDNAVDCYMEHNSGASGGYGDYPLCSVELVADMAAAVDTPTCMRRENLPIPYLNGVNYCDPLGDQNVWGSLFNLTVNNTDEVIMLATKLDSISFFPNSGSLGASSEVAAIATMLAVIQQLGQVKRAYNGSLSLSSQILYTFFQGESWDNIGSSRMAYDMKQGDFPENEDLPRVFLGNISHFIEFGQLGLMSERTVYVHGNKSSDFRHYLGQVGNITVLDSSRAELPPASLKRFISEGVMEENEDFSGLVITSFDDRFRNPFFGSRFDDINNFGGRSIDEVANDLAAVATAVAKAVFNTAGPSCSNVSCAEVEESIDADSQLIEDVLTCFLSNSSCDFFRSILVKEWADQFLPLGPISRYVGTENSVKIETFLIQQIMAYFTANNASELENPVKCKDCLKRINDDNHNDPTVNITWIPYYYNSSDEDSDPMCLCIESFKYTHTATSPLFAYKLDYDSQYSSWAESTWTTTNVRFYLITYPLQEVGFLFLGLFFTAISLLVSIQCTRKGTAIFQIRESYSVVTT